MKLTFLCPQAFGWNSTLLPSFSAAGAVQLEERCTVLISVTNIRVTFFLQSASDLLSMCSFYLECVCALVFSCTYLSELCLNLSRLLAVSTRKFGVNLFTVTTHCFLACVLTYARPFHLKTGPFLLLLNHFYTQLNTGVQTSKFKPPIILD